MERFREVTVSASKQRAAGDNRPAARTGDAPDADKARQGQVVLGHTWQRVVFFGALIAAFALGAVALIMTV
ncbi:MAG: hypothetical protein IPM60_12040 [Rhodospirillales bacterium]|nr:hypothetical protein [Rhodospirillales bacterium]